MAEPVFAVDEVRYYPGEPRERLFVGDSLDAIERYRLQIGDGGMASDFRGLTLSWHEVISRIVHELDQLAEGLHAYYATEQDAAILYV